MCSRYNFFFRPFLSFSLPMNYTQILHDFPALLLRPIYIFTFYHFFGDSTDGLTQRDLVVSQRNNLSITCSKVLQRYPIPEAQLQQSGISCLDMYWMQEM